MNQQQLQKFLNSPRVPHNLEHQLLNNWEQQMGKELINQHQQRWIKHLAIAASLTLCLILTSLYWQTPNLISAAYADINKDTHQDNGFSSEHFKWLRQFDIVQPPKTMKVEMTKYCNLSNYQSTHFRIAGKKQGKVDIFFLSEDKLRRWGKNEGMINDLHWKLLQVHDKLTVIVLYTQDMHASGVQKLLNTMLPEKASYVI